ncbi:MAG: helix-turn-helix transcriptional regulator [Clostridia bacterium]|nr:helix-turn-helix transcriptional regulator [Clostridia bacterium]
MNYLLKNMLSDGALLCPIYRKEANRFLDRLDFHPHYELYLCRAPIPQSMVIGGEERTVLSPCAMILPPFTVHHISLKEPRASFERYVIYFGEELLSRFDRRVLCHSLTDSSGGILIPLSEAEADLLTGMSSFLYREESTEEERACTLALLLNTLSRMGGERETVSFAQTPTDVPKILEYIYENVALDLNADRLAALFNISRPKLDRDFRRYVGQSVHKTVMDCRISLALSLLRNTDLSIGEIASRCGFESEYYFYSFFKRLTGHTPSEWRSTTDLSAD